MKSTIAIAMATLALTTQGEIVYKQVTAAQAESFHNAATTTSECDDIIKGWSSTDPGVYVPRTAKGEVLFVVDDATFIPEEPCYEAVKDFISTTDPADANKCFTENTTKPGKYVYNAGGALVCGIAGGDECKVDQLCQPTDVTKDAIACDEVQKYCPKSPKYTKIMKSVVNYGVHYKDPRVIYFLIHLAEFQKGDYLTNCRSLDGYKHPSDSTGHKLVVYTALDSSTTFDKCKTAYERSYTDAKKKYDADDSVIEKIHVKIDSVEEVNFDVDCFDDKEGDILCQNSNVNCSIKCDDDEVCGEDDKDVCGGTCVETTTGMECTSSTTQLVSAIATIAALAVAFF